MSRDYYDQQKAHEYYEQHKKLKGRRSTKGFSQSQKERWDYAKHQINEDYKDTNKALTEDSKEKRKQLSESAKMKIQAIRNRMKGMSKEQKEALRGQIASIREILKGQKQDITEATKSAREQNKANKEGMLDTAYAQIKGRKKGERKK